MMDLVEELMAPRGRRPRLEDELPHPPRPANGRLTDAEIRDWMYWNERVLLVMAMQQAQQTKLLKWGLGVITTLMTPLAISATITLLRGGVPVPG